MKHLNKTKNKNQSKQIEKTRHLLGDIFKHTKNKIITVTTVNENTNN